MIKRMAKEMLKRYYEVNRWNKLEDRERNICLSHPDWEPLTRSEISKINKKEKHAYMIYKNMQFFSPNFVSDAYYQTTLLPMLNNYDYLFFGNFVPTDFSDKNYFEIFMPSLRFPDAVIRKINGYFYDDGYNRISMEKAISLVMENDTLVLKKSVDSGHGEGVKKVSAAQLRDRIMGGYEDKNYIVQKVIQQHGFLEYYNSSSVNIIRITTLLWGNEIYNLGAILRVGAPGSFCDLVSNGTMHPLIIPVRDDGSLGKNAYDPDGFNKYDNVFGKRIEGFIPHYKDMVNLAAKAHEKYVNHRIIGWDFTIDTDGEVICVEYNSRCPGIVQSQIALGPIFDIKNAIGEAFLDCMKRGSL